MRNAIPRESKANIAFNPAQEREILILIEQQISLIKNEFNKEPNLSIKIESVQSLDICLDELSQRLLLSCLYDCPNGVIEMSKEIPDLVETSSNMASIHASGEEKIEIITSQRSSVESSKHEIASQIRSIFEPAGAKVVHSDSYPGWSPNADSEILRITETCYKRLFKTEPKVKAIHAGLECGLFLEKYPELDMVSIGPTIKGAHSPDERMEINTVEKFWKLMLEVLRSIPEEIR